MSDPRGQFKIFLGMAAGVGKTYRMLAEGQAAAEAGRDVVIGLLETHGREQTAALAAGKIYPSERISGALSNFFTVSNLTALREVSLRQAAEEVEAKRLPAPGETTTGPPADRSEDRFLHTAAPQAIGERLMAIVVPQPSAQRVVRRAWRSAQRLGSELDVLWVAAGEPDEQQAEQLAALRRLCSVLGAHLLIEHGDDVPHVVARVARERRTTYVLMGTPRPRHAWQRMQRSDLPTRLLELMPGVDVRIVADRSQQDDGTA